MLTLREVIQIRQHKYDKEKQNQTYTDFWKGYMEGWRMAYTDLTQILEQNGFNLDLFVVEEKRNEQKDTNNSRRSR